MDIFSRAKDTLTETGKELSQRASDVSGIARNNIKLMEDERRLTDAYRKLAEEFAVDYPEVLARLYPEFSATICEIKAEIEKDKREIAGYRGRKVCPNCGKEEPVQASFCMDCGADIRNIEPPVPERRQVEVCSSCGQPLNEGGEYCMHCGAKKVKDSEPADTEQPADKDKEM